MIQFMISLTKVIITFGSKYILGEISRLIFGLNLI